MSNIISAPEAQAPLEVTGQISGRHAEIARRYAWDDRHRKSQRRPRLIPNLRLRELERFYLHIYGPTLPDDDAGRDDLFVVAQHLAQGGTLDRHLPAWARVWCPWLGELECSDIVARVTSTPLRWTADALASRIGLDDATRTLLKITTIGATDCNKAQRAERRKQLDADAHRARRAKDRDHKQAKPWEIQGISRRTWFRRGKPTAPDTVALNPSTADEDYIAVDANSATSDPTSPHNPAFQVPGTALPPIFQQQSRARLAPLAVSLAARGQTQRNRMSSAPARRW
jgi:hypothetical protein